MWDEKNVPIGQLKTTVKVLRAFSLAVPTQITKRLKSQVESEAANLRYKLGAAEELLRTLQDQG